MAKDMQDNAKRGERIKASSWQENVRQTRIGARKLTVAKDSGLTLRDTSTGQILSTDIRRFQKRIAATSVLRYAYVKAVSTSAPQEVGVQFLKKTKTVDGSTRFVTWSDDGDMRIALVPPNFAGTDFERLKFSRWIEGRTPVVRVEKAGEDWMIAFVPRWAFRDLPSNAEITRCS